MNWVDGVAIGVLILSGVMSFWRGFVRETLGIAAWVGAVIAGFALRPFTKPMFETYLDPPWLADGLAVGAAFLVVLVALTFVVNTVANRVEDSALGGVDRSLGFVFGLARGGFLIVLAYIIAGLFLPAVDRWPEAVREARGLPWVVRGAETVAELLPPEYRPRIATPPERREPTQEDLLRPRVGSRT
ncbi:CvpA family protein [Rhodovarius lipocyclicus]|uniref:CvpA family protein n=1 Tax=Rhodovarius lipocyclicus TaxID=268410 RepID=UPI00135BFA61|nr:CvpA family protein [Rhodovarius lipocyclicus]